MLVEDDDGIIAPPFCGRSAAARCLRPLGEHPCVAYDETLPLVRPFFEAVFGTSPENQATVVAPDLRILLKLAASGTGWTVLPDYLCAEALASGALAELPTPRPCPHNRLYLAWNRGSLRHPRLVHARDRLLTVLAGSDRDGTASHTPRSTARHRPPG